MIGVTLTVPNTATSLATLLATKYPLKNDEMFSEIRIEADIANTDDIFIGNQNVSVTEYGARLPNVAVPPLSVFQFGMDRFAGNTARIFLIAAINNEVVHVFMR